MSAPKLKPVGVGWPSCNQACDGKQQPLDKGQRPPAPESPEKPPACLAGRISMSQRTGLNLEAMLQTQLVPALQGRQILCERKLNTQNGWRDRKITRSRGQELIPEEDNHCNPSMRFCWVARRRAVYLWEHPERKNRSSSQPKSNTANI